MKTVRSILYFVAALAVCACAKDTRYVPDLSEGISKDFNSRYPRVKILDSSQWQSDSHTITEISFVDRDRFENKAIYQDDQWMLTSKTYDVESYMSTLPLRILMTFLDAGIHDEHFSDNDYIIEVARNGMDQKQYEIHCSAPYLDVPAQQAYDSWQYHIVIAEDGTLLSCHHSSYNSTISWFDMSASTALIRDKYGDAEFLGAVNDAGSNVFFIRDDNILKTVTTHKTWTYEWKDTRYPLPIYTPLPASAMDAKTAYEAENPGARMFALYFIDSPEGTFYGLTYGSEMKSTTVYAPIE